MTKKNTQSIYLKHPVQLVVFIFIRKILVQRVFTETELCAIDDPVPSWSDVFRPIARGSDTSEIGGDIEDKGPRKKESKDMNGNTNSDVITMRF